MLTYLAQGFFSPTQPQQFSAAVLDGALDSAGMLCRAGVSADAIFALQGLLQRQGLDLFADFAPDTVKIDMALVRGIDADGRRQAIVRGIVGMCRELETRVVGEGVETAEEAAALRKLGVTLQQGYHYAKPAFEVLPEVQF